jgi:hypothetical protein
VTTQTIPTYSATGSRLRSSSLARIDHLLSLSLVVVTRNKRGQICAATFRPSNGANPLRTSCHQGQRYSMLAQCGNHRAWKHKDPPNKARLAAEFLVDGEAPSEEEMDLFVRAIFRAVPLSCLTDPQMDAYRRRQAAQPLERKAA